MKQLFIQLNAAILLLLSFSFHCQGADTYTLKYNLKEGKTYKQHNVSAIHVAMNGMEISMKMSIDMNFDVTGKTNDGYNLRMTFQRITMNMTSPTVYTLDSDPAGNSSDKNNAELLKTLAGVPIDIQLTENGKVTSIKGVDSLLEKINAAGNSQVQQLFSQQFSENAIQKMIEQGSCYFPDKPVAAGDSWDINNTLSTNGVDIINKMTVTLKQVANNIATTDLTGTLTTPEGGTNTEMQGMDAKVSVNGTQSGTVQLDMKTGWIVSMEITQKFAQNIEAMGQTMQQQVELNTTVTGE